MARVDVRPDDGVELEHSEALFMCPADAVEHQLFAALPHRFDSEEEAIQFLERCKNATFTIKDVEKKPVAPFPALPFTTSTPVSSTLLTLPPK